MFSRLLPRLPFSRPQARTARRFFFTGGVFLAATAAGTCTVWCAAPVAKAPAVKGPPFDYAAVRRDIEALLDGDLSLAPFVLRLAWHQAGTWSVETKDGGANSGSMRFAPECRYAANAGLLEAQKALEAVKAKHPKITYGDLWSLAGVVAVEQMGGPAVPWRWGRTEAKGPEACPPDGRLPNAALDADHIRTVFNRMGFTSDRDIVALIGAHSVGECHADRSGYVGPWTHDKYGFGNALFTELLNNEWIVDKRRPKLQFKDAATGDLMMLPTDIALLFDPSFRTYVNLYAANGEAFNRDFARAFGRLMELGTHELKDVPTQVKGPIKGK